MLKAVVDNFGVHLGLKCSSFSKMNVGTSARCPCMAIGYETFASVCLGNMLLERSDFIFSQCIHTCMHVELKYYHET